MVECISIVFLHNGPLCPDAEDLFDLGNVRIEGPLCVAHLVELTSNAGMNAVSMREKKIRTDRLSMCSELIGRL